MSKLKERRYPIKLTTINSTTIQGYIKTDYGVYECKFSIDTGIGCECGFKNKESDRFADDKIAYEFCDHITAFLLYLLELREKDPQVCKFIDDIVPNALQHKYILSYLLSKGLIMKEKDGKYHCSQFGRLIIRLYLYPTSGVLIRNKLENVEIVSSKDLLNESYDVLISERRVRDHKMRDPLIEWADEIPIEDILERYKIMAGDLNSTRQNLERIITFTGIIASHLSTVDPELRDKLVKVAEMSETLRIRLHYGIREELFDLVLRLDNVGRVRARILHKAGFRTANQVLKENPYVLNHKTGLGLKICKKIIGTNKKAKKKRND